MKTEKLEYSGQYKNDARDGSGILYKPRIHVNTNLNTQMELLKTQRTIDESKYLDSLEKNKDKIQDPEKTDVLK